MDTLRRRYHSVGNKINTVVAYLSAIQDDIEQMQGTAPEQVQELVKKCQTMERNIVELEDLLSRIKSINYRFVDPNKDISHVIEEMAIDNKDLKILIIDDEEDLCSLLKETVSRLGFQVQTATNIADASRSILDNTPNIVLLDLYMQEGMEGLEILRLIRQERSWVKCLVITCEHNEDVLATVREFHPAEIMIKPVTPFQLQAKINGLVSSLENR